MPFLFLGIFNFIYFQSAFIITNALAPFLLPFLIYVAIKCLQKGNKTAIFYIIAQITFISLASVYCLMSGGKFSTLIDKLKKAAEIRL